MSCSDDAAAATPVGSDPPAWILLDKHALIEDRHTHNASTATALASTGQPVQVTLVAAEPPRDSYFPSLNRKRNHDDEGRTDRLHGR